VDRQDPEGKSWKKERVQGLAVAPSPNCTTARSEGAPAGCWPGVALRGQRRCRAEPFDSAQGRARRYMGRLDAGGVAQAVSLCYQSRQGAPEARARGAGSGAGPRRKKRMRASDWRIGCDGSPRDYYGPGSVWLWLKRKAGTELLRQAGKRPRQAARNGRRPLLFHRLVVRQHNGRFPFGRSMAGEYGEHNSPSGNGEN
jgi:hypothetical protein